MKIYKTENYALMVKTADFSDNFTESLTYTDKYGYEFLEKSFLYAGELLLSNIGSIEKVFLVPYFNRPMTLASNSIMIKCHNKINIFGYIDTFYNQKDILRYWLYQLVQLCLNLIRGTYEI